jgi:hypothetical protein
MDPVQQDINNQFRDDDQVWFKQPFFFGPDCVKNIGSPYLKRKDNWSSQYEFKFLDVTRPLTLDIRKGEYLNIDKINYILQKLKAFLKEEFEVKDGRVTALDTNNVESCWIEEYSNIFNIL